MMSANTNFDVFFRFQPGFATICNVLDALSFLSDYSSNELARHKNPAKENEKNIEKVVERNATVQSKAKTIRTRGRKKLMKRMQLYNRKLKRYEHVDEKS